ncbi:hypothetical protein BYT27DRAFT_6393086 [Phlegmacium glaucopus]|nr:hypothetical protein BYT27DRAFT_6393086 [Phlegmacium glaucopus]
MSLLLLSHVIIVARRRQTRHMSLRGLSSFRCALSLCIVCALSSCVICASSSCVVCVCIVIGAKNGEVGPNEPQPLFLGQNKLIQYNRNYKKNKNCFIYGFWYCQSRCCCTCRLKSVR